MKLKTFFYTVSGKLVLASRVEKRSLDFKDGDSIVLVLPDGNEIKTIISSGGKFKVHKTLVQTILVDDLMKEDAPVGTEIFLEA